MTLIITHSDQDGAYCSGYLGQKYTNSKFFISSNKSIAEKIIQTKEKSLIIIADIVISKDIEAAILSKLQTNPYIRFIIFEHHFNEPYIQSIKRVEVFWDSISKCNNVYLLVRRWISGDKRNHVPKTINNGRILLKEYEENKES